MSLTGVVADEANEEDDEATYAGVSSIDRLEIG
jgi:hypothetical protein